MVQAIEEGLMERKIDRDKRDEEKEDALGNKLGRNYDLDEDEDEDTVAGTERLRAKPVSAEEGGSEGGRGRKPLARKPLGKKPGGGPRK